MGIEAQFQKVEEKLFQNRYIVDSGQPHIRITPHDKPSKALLAMTHLCPAGCYSTAETGQVEITADGCLECGTCRVLCELRHPLQIRLNRRHFRLQAPLK
jgi:ferredoxin like protein